MSTRDEFMALRETPIHALRGNEWPAYYSRLRPFLRDPQADIREMAVERYMMALFRAEAFAPDYQSALARERLDAFVRDVEQAHDEHGDVLAEVLRGFRWHGDDKCFPALLAPWLSRLAANPPKGVDPGLVVGAQLLIGAGAQDQRDLAELTAYLDAPSDWVRGCAARRLADGLDDAATRTFLAPLAAREIARPGVAGPFCSSHYSGFSYAPWTDAEGLTDWLMTLLEQRQGPAPDDMPFNDIAFYLHELCSQSPARVQRMIDGGFFELAYLTATEEADQWPRMRPLMAQLTACGDAHVAEAARHLLAQR